MSFTLICVGIVIVILILLITGLISAFAGLAYDDLDYTFMAGWFMPSVGFALCLALCLTIILYRNGVIK